jgi:hypothetical protein
MIYNVWTALDVSLEEIQTHLEDELALDISLMDKPTEYQEPLAPEPPTELAEARLENRFLQQP